MGAPHLQKSAVMSLVQRLTVSAKGGDIFTMGFLTEVARRYSIPGKPLSRLSFVFKLTICRAIRRVEGGIGRHQLSTACSYQRITGSGRRTFRQGVNLSL